MKLLRAMPLVILLVLAGCGSDPEPPQIIAPPVHTTTAVPTPTSVPPTTTTVITVASPTGIPPVTVVVPRAPAPSAAAPARLTQTSAPSSPRRTTAAPEPVVDEPAPAASYKNCSEVKAAGAAPIREGDPGFKSKFDRDGDGVGCE